MQEVSSGDTIVDTLGPSEGKFTFTSHDSGDHTICLATNQTSSWFTSSHIRLYLNIAVGAVRHDVEKDRAHATKLSDKIRDLNDKLDMIRREQQVWTISYRTDIAPTFCQYQREREAQFRNLSESVNAKAMWYMLLQALFLIGTVCTFSPLLKAILTLPCQCYWQLRFLKVRSHTHKHSSLLTKPQYFFADRKGR